ncbi:MAG: EpsG family protein [Bacteroidetes bacterium]|jgi:hypothetical protein|nr:EpsG family protein [Bacteroidota bacterium]
MIYLILFFVFLLIGLAEINEVGYNKNVYGVLFFVSAIVLIFVAGFRFYSGYDYLEYQSLYENTTMQNYMAKAIDPGFALLISSLRNWGFSFYAFIFLLALVSISLKFNYIQQHSALLFVALINYYTIGFLINEMGQIRHGIALAIALFAFNNLRDGNAAAYFLKVLIGFLLHGSILILVPIWFLFRYVKVAPKAMFWILLLLMPFLFIDIKGVLFKTLEFIPIFQIQAKMVFYLYTDQYNQKLGFNISFVLRLLTLAGLIIIQNRTQLTNRNIQLWIQLYFWGTVIYMVFSSVSEFAIRLSTYFKTLDLVIYPFLIAALPNRWQKNLLYLLLGLYGLWSLYKVVYAMGNESTFLPYQNLVISWLYE